ncbi:hypothetical protein FRC03_005081 [Tulasnella sp. 419]|nr:hypothetical protein FRC03_005081 [Tulasnella sp. 419]
MNVPAAAPAWKQFNFFDVIPVKDAHDLASSPEVFKSTPEISCITSSSAGVLVADIHGTVHLLGQDFVPIRSWVAHDAGRVTHMVERGGILVTLGEDPSTRLPILKIWDLEHFDKKTGAPLLLRSAKVQVGNRPHPVCVIALSASLSHLAIGMGDGTVLLYRQFDQTLFSSSFPKPKVIHESPKEPITGLGFREPRPVNPGAEDATQEKSDTLLHLFIVTTNQVISYAFGKGASSQPTIVDEVGCGLGCAVMDLRAREMVVARDEAIYMCGPDGRGACYAYEGPKSSVYSHKTYAVIVSPPFYPTVTNASATVRNYVARAPDSRAATQQDISKVTIFDVENKYVAFSGPFKEGVREVVSQWDQLYVLANDGKLYLLEEKPTSAKLDTLFRQSRFLLAINLAKTQGVDEAGIADIHRQYGDHLYSKGDDDGAMTQYIKTLGYLQPSYVIRKFLDAKRITNLTTYLQELHSRGLANSDHTTLLLNTYTKLKDVSRLDNFIKNAEKTHAQAQNGTGNAAELPFDLETAIRVCRQAGYFDHAVYLAKKYERHDDYLKIQIEDAGHFKDALAYMRELGPEVAETNLARYGRSMLISLPDEMTQMLIDLCSGASLSPPQPPPNQENAPPSPTKGGSGGSLYFPYLTYNRGNATEPAANSSVTGSPALPSEPLPQSSQQQQQQQQLGHQRTASNARRSHHDVVTSSAPPSPPPGQTRRGPLKRRPSPRQYFAHFVDHLNHFSMFLEAVAWNRWGQQIELEDGGNIANDSTPVIPSDGFLVDEESEKADQVSVWNTLLELYLTLSAKELEAGNRKASVIIKNKALAILKGDSRGQKFPYDQTHALIICSTKDFTEGLVILWEQMGMYEDILRFWMEKENSNVEYAGSTRPSVEVVRHLSLYGPSHPHLYPFVLRFLTSTPALLSRHTKDVEQILEVIHDRKIIPPLGVVQVLSRNGVASVGLVKGWLMKRIMESKEEVDADRQLIASYRNETESKLKEVAELSDPEHPRVFHVTRCSACGGQLDLPSIHFMCKHSYHQRCLGEHENECPNCARTHGMIREIRRDNERFADQHDLFLRSVEETGLDAIASGFSKGVL